MVQSATVYRKDVNGLRAIAVGSVVLFHADKAFLPGGFVGVDVFFVISGYLISRIIVSELHEGRFSLAHFYAKRMKRILPALLLVLLSTWGAAWVLIDPPRFEALGHHLHDGSFFILNFRLLRENSYFDVASRAKPLLHLWSLSIEEQFYIVWPLLLMIAFKLAPKRGAAAIALVFAASLAANLVLTERSPTLAFYLPWSRFWELALGALLAHRELTSRSAAPSRLRTNLAFATGVLVLVLGLALLNESQPFPGWRALVPTLGCALIIACPGSTWSERVLGNRPAQALGTISYPLYLWHWPLFSFAAIVGFDAAWAPFALAMLAVALASLTYVLVEKPVARLFGRREKTVTAALALLLVATGLLGLYTIKRHGFAERMPAEIARFYEFEHHKGFESLIEAMSCFDSLKDAPASYDAPTALATGEKKHCFDVKDPSKPVIVILGDSHAGHFARGIDTLFGERANIVNLVASGCVPLVDHVVAGNGRSGTRRCGVINAARLELISKLKPDVVVAGAYFRIYLDEPDFRYPDYAREVLSGVSSLLAAGAKHVLIAGEVPVWSPSLPTTMARALAAGRPIGKYATESLRVESLNIDRKLRALPWPEGSVYASVTDALCKKDKGCLTRLGDDLPEDLTSFDYGHLTRSRVHRRDARRAGAHPKSLAGGKSNACPAGQPARQWAMIASQTAKPLFSYRKYWAHRFGIAPFLPMSARGNGGVWAGIPATSSWSPATPISTIPVSAWRSSAGCSKPRAFGSASSPSPTGSSAESFKTLGKPNLFFGVTAGNMDSMVNRYTSDRRMRHDDSYTPGGEGGKRPDRCRHRLRPALPRGFSQDVPIVIGGIEASLRRIAHYDYWSDKVRRSVLVDSKADLLLYGNAERAVVEVAHRLAKKRRSIRTFPIFAASAFMRDAVPEGWTEAHADDLDARRGRADRQGRQSWSCACRPTSRSSGDREAYARASRVLHRESNPGNARPLVQQHGDREVWLTPPPIPLTTPEMDGVYDLPYARAPHPAYGGAKIPAWEMIRHSR